MLSLTGQMRQIFIVTINLHPILYPLSPNPYPLPPFENHRFKSVKACRPKSRQAKVNEN
ncbi:MAG: hypothetical protein LBP59_20210 [Planctomycetaceae bacterium]|nr:hypothetical protein [Planctomycetaceae bacterium]